MHRLLPVRLLAIACQLSLGALACREAPSLIQLGPLPDRIAELDEDAGPELPDGAVACRDAADCDDGVECTNDVCLAEGYCRSTTDYARCDDGVFCNGIEVCDAREGCLEGVPMACDDSNACTIDRCDEAKKACQHAPRDFDHDGEVDVHCAGGTDCDDFDEKRGTRVNEVCSDLVDNDCDELVDERACGKIMHDSCDDALDISAGGTFELPVLGAVGDYSITCPASAEARDLVFSFMLKEPRDVQLEARGLMADGSEQEASLALQTSCGVRSTELQCAIGFPANLRARALPAGRYYVIASTLNTRSLWLSASTSAATAPQPNPSCDTAIDVSQGGRFEGDFVDVGDDSQSPCGIKGQPDVFYKFSLTAESDVELSAASEEPGDLTICVRDGCDESSMVRGCRSAGPALTRLHQLPPGDYVIVLEGPTSREVSYGLEVAILPPTPPPPGENCMNPIPVTVGKPELVQLSDKQAEVMSTCESTGPDAVLSLKLDAASDVAINAMAEDASAVVAFQDACGVPDSERSCMKGSPLRLPLRNVPAGEYFLIVDSQTAPSVMIEVETSPASPPIEVSGNDNCQSAQLVPALGGQFLGDTRTLLRDYGATCGGEAQSPDAVFRIELTRLSRVIAILEGQFDGVLHYMRDDRSVSQVCQPYVAERCIDDTSGKAPPKLDEILAAGTYYFVVDGFRDGSAGTYKFDVVITQP